LGIATLLLIRGRVWEVRLTVTAAGPSQLRGGLSTSSVLAGLMPPTGFQSSPLIVAQLMQLDGVLAEVGRTPVGASTRSIGQALLGDNRSSSRQALLRKLQRILRIDTDRMSGLITVRVAHRDSAIVRAVAAKLLEQTRIRFATVVRAQAQEARLALMARVDSAKRQLLAREDALRHYTSASRSASDFSQASLNAGRLRRETELADAVYRQAALDYEAAVAHELEVAPALLVVDGSPGSISRLKPSVLSSLVFGLAACYGTLTILLLLTRSFQKASTDAAS
ncbi:MAG: hypothetical protein ACREMA_06880, partial [Longimicrobiales bacterium]